MHCHTTNQVGESTASGRIALVGQPNVGKSVIFQRLTGQHVTVSNYPGTTVEVTRGKAHWQQGVELIDTPGVVTFPPHTEDEQVTARLLFNEPLRAVVQVGDAKNLRRTLFLAVQFAEMGLPMVMALNMMDEAEARGVAVNADLLAEHLDLPVVLTTATRGHGIDRLVASLEGARPPQFRLQYAPKIEAALAEICLYLPAAPITARALALLWLSHDQVTETWLEKHLEGAALQPLVDIRDATQLALLERIETAIQQTRLDYVEQVTSAVMLEAGEGWQGLSAFIGRISTHSFFGLIILGLVLYGMYWFVGVFGAVSLVNLLEVRLFGEVINPWVVDWLGRLLPVPLARDFIVGEYGLWSMGMTYALALILPIVSTFFLAFGFLEDSGYLPRLAALSNRLFQMLGLNGKAVLPMILGLGCVTMSTLTTRVLESKRERLLVTLLLALAVPCSAQLGVVMGMLAGISFSATLVWSGVVLAVFLLIGWLAARLMPGERTPLLIELPPLRWPMFSNILVKTLARLEWYLKEVVPLFLLGTALMFILDKTSVLDILTRLGEPLVVTWLGLPAEASAAFLMGFLRRDFGATGLFMMEAQGLLNPLQVVVAMVTVTLFIPCIASVIMIARERTWRTAITMLVLIFPLAFLVGGLLNRALLVVGWGV